ncbi:MAG: tRNA dihydrouridine synthase DusB [Planctomycetota bacterium]|nr:MAG: tRNA dihydrouridine synthase DusB [Planctomycetota bacterium]
MLGGGVTLAAEAARYIHPLRIGNLELANNLTLAPMAGYTNVAFRLIAKEVGGCGLVASEMVAAMAPEHAKHEQRFRVLTATVPAERPIAMQVYGRNPEWCADLARRLADAGADMVDLNCGCPVRKATQNGCGVALMKEPQQIEAILRAMRAAVPERPVTVKMRLGANQHQQTVLEVARRAEDAGVDAIFIHARTGESKHGQPVDLEPVAAVKAAAGVPVIVNGSMDTAAAIRRAKDEAGVDGYQIGRAACGDPWLFRNLIAELKGEPLHQPSLDERRQLLERHFDLILQLFGEERGVRVMRKYTFFYCQGLPGVRAFRERFVRIANSADFAQVVEEFFSQLQDRLDAGQELVPDADADQILIQEG